MKYAYIRVSKEDQNTARQVDGLKSLCDELVIEKISATAKDRPKFTALLHRLKENDTLAVWSLDRAFRSTVDAIQQADKLRARNVNFVIVDLNVDTATPSGMLVYSVMAAMAQFERENLIERTKQGLEAAKKRGVRLGRPPTLRHKQIKKAQEEIEARRESVASMAALFGVDRSTMFRALKKQDNERST